MKIEVINKEGKKVGVQDVPDFFQVKKINEHLIWEAVKAEQANKRQGTHKTKVKGDVSGGGRKPWKQKGTGRARAGSTRSPVWSGGGTVFGPKPRDYREDFPRKKKKVAIRHAIAKKLKDGRVVVLDGFQFDEIKTASAFKSVNEILKATSFYAEYAQGRKLGSDNSNYRKITIVLNEDKTENKLSLKNIPWIQVIHASRLAMLPLHYNHGLFISKEALVEMEKKLTV